MIKTFDRAPLRRNESVTREKKSTPARDCHNGCVLIYSCFLLFHKHKEAGTQPQNSRRKFLWLTVAPTAVYALYHPLCLSIHTQ